MKNKLFTIFALAILISCDSVTTRFNNDKFGDVSNLVAPDLLTLNIVENKNKVTIDVPKEFLPNKVESIKYKDIIDTIWYIPLETTKKSLLRSIGKVIMHEGNIFIIDAIDNIVLKFGPDGKFETTIGEKGRGPHEYLSALNFEIVNNEILLLDDRAAKMKYYDLNGVFLKEKKLQFRMNQFMPLNDKVFVCDITDRDNFHIPSVIDYKIILCDLDWKIIGRADGFDGANASKFSNSTPVFSRFNNELLYNPCYQYTLYG